MAKLFQGIRRPQETSGEESKKDHSPPFESRKCSGELFEGTVRADTIQEACTRAKDFRQERAAI